MVKKVTLLWVATWLALSSMGCGVQSIPMAKNEVEAQLAEVSNQYKTTS